MVNDMLAKGSRAARGWDLSMTSGRVSVQLMGILISSYSMAVWPLNSLIPLEEEENRAML